MLPLETSKSKNPRERPDVSLPVSRRFRRLRRYSGLKLAQVSVQTDINISTLSLFEGGYISLQSHKLARLESVLLKAIKRNIAAARRVTGVKCG